MANIKARLDRLEPRGRTCPTCGQGGHAFGDVRYDVVLHGIPPKPGDTRTRVRDGEPDRTPCPTCGRKPIVVRLEGLGDVPVRGRSH